MPNKKTLVSFDWAMKSILKRPENFAVLEGFLSALLGDENIEILEILESESTQKYELDKFNRVDLKAKDSSGEIIIVELQYNSEADYLPRIYYGVSKLVSEHMRLGMEYGEIPKIISVSIVYFELTNSSYAAKGGMKFKDINSGEYISGIKNESIFAEYYFIQPKWFDDNIRTALDEWVYMFKHSEIAEGSKSKNIEKAKIALEFAKMTPQEQSDFDYYWNISVRSAINVRKAAIEEGVAKGKQNKAIEMAKKMKELGMSVEQIAQISGLTEGQISKL